MPSHKSGSQPTRKAAEMLAIQALAFIAEEPQTLVRFLEATGLEAVEIRTAARQAGVLEHMLGDETLLLAFADRTGTDPAAVARAASALGGSGHWERDLP